MTVLPTLLTAVQAAQLTNESRTQEPRVFEDTWFRSMVYTWNEEIRRRAEAGSNELVIATNYVADDIEAICEFALQYENQGYKIEFTPYIVLGSVPRLKVRLTWPLPK